MWAARVFGKRRTKVRSVGSFLKQSPTIYDLDGGKFLSITRENCVEHVEHVGPRSRINVRLEQRTNTLSIQSSQYVELVVEDIAVRRSKPNRLGAKP